MTENAMRSMPSMTYRRIRTYPEGVTATAPGENGQANVRMTPTAIDALRELARPQAESVARAIAAIGQAEGRPVAIPQDAQQENGNGNGRQYLAMVPDDDHAPVVMYRDADDGGYLVTALVDRATYKTYEIAEQPGFLQSTTFKAAVGAVAATAVGILLGSRALGKSPT
jgi:hypothetical protein